MVQNPLSSETSSVVDALIAECQTALETAPANTRPLIEDLMDNLRAFQSSDESPWVEYRETVPFDFIEREFRGRLNRWCDGRVDAMRPSESGNQTLMEQVASVLEQEGFHPETVGQGAGVRFVGNPEKAAHLIDARLDNHIMSVVESGSGGLVLALGDRFKGDRFTEKGTPVISEAHFNRKVQEFKDENPAFVRLLDGITKAAETFAAEGDMAFTPTPTSATPAAPSSPAAPTTPAAPAPSFIPDAFIQAVQQNLHLLPPDVSTMITSEIVNIQIKKDDPDPDDTPKCKPMLRREPPDGRMTRIDSYNSVNSGLTNGDGFGWSVVGLAEQDRLYRQTSTVKTQFSVKVQPALREILPVPAPPSGWTKNQTLPQSCAEQLRLTEVTRLPSVSADALPIGVTFVGSSPDAEVPTDIHYHKDGADQLYLEVRDYDPRKHSNMVFMVDLCHPPYSQIIDKRALFSVNMSFADYAAGQGIQYGDQPAEASVLTNQGVADADRVLANRGITADQPIGSTLADLYAWLYGEWMCEDIPSNKRDMIGEYLRTRAGACRHRAYIMFLALNRLGLPCRFLGSTCHAWPEIWNPDKGAWVQVDLNGCGDDDNDGCEPCEVRNPWYGLREKCCPEGYTMNGSGECQADDGSGNTTDPIDCPKCIPKECPENHECHPLTGECIPDCDTLYGSDFIYSPVRKACVNCDDEGLRFDWSIGDCNCHDCPPDETWDGTNCLDEDGNISTNAPVGLYRDTTTGICLPREDCDTLMPGTAFNETTGRCECFPKMGPEGQEIPMRWSDEEGRCVEDKDKTCPEGEVLRYDASLGIYRCVKITDLPPAPPRPDPTPSPVDPEDEEEEEENTDIIIDGKAVIARTTYWLNMESGGVEQENPRNPAFREISTKSCRLQGRASNGKPHQIRAPIPADLHGLGAWMDLDADKDLIAYFKANEGQNTRYQIMVVAKEDRLEAAEAHLALWERSLADSEFGIAGVNITRDPAGRGVSDYPNCRGVLYLISHA